MLKTAHSKIIPVQKSASGILEASLEAWSGLRRMKGHPETICRDVSQNAALYLRTVCVSCIAFRGLSVIR
jgi:hypothetical protein